MRLTLGQVAEVRLGRQRAPQHETGDFVVPYLRSANVTDGDLALTDVKAMNFSPEEQKLFKLEQGDVLVTEGSGSRDTVGTSAVWNDELPGPVCFQNTLLRLRPRSGVTDSRYLAWWARHARTSGQIAAVSTGANILHIGSEGLKRLRLTVPNIGEQRRIADFLDERIARVDQIIAARREQLTALGADETSSSFETVRGAAVEGGRRESGLSWLGAVPSEWPVLTVQSQFLVELGKMLDEKRQTNECPLPYLRNTNVQWDRVDVDDLKVMDIATDERVRYTVRVGDLLICEGGQPGRAAIWDGRIQELGFQKALHRARTRGRTRPAWLLECLRVAVKTNAFAAENGVTTIGHLTNEQLRRQRFPFPDPDVQERLLAALKTRADARAQAHSFLRQSIHLLVEFKSSLITAAVTGDLDITTAASGIPA